MGTRDLPNPAFFIFEEGEKRNEMKSKNGGSRAGRRKQDGVGLGPHLTCNYSSVPTVPTVKNNSAKPSEVVKQVKSLSSKLDNLSSPIPRTHTVKERADPRKFSSQSHRYTTAHVHATLPYATPPFTH